MSVVKSKMATLVGLHKDGSIDNIDDPVTRFVIPTKRSLVAVDMPPSIAPNMKSKMSQVQILHLRLFRRNFQEHYWYLHWCAIRVQYLRSE
jgi:hypothetical protein